MDGNLHSLTDVLKRTLFFFDNLSTRDLAPYVRRKMLQDLSLDQVEEKVDLCVKQHSCFAHDGKKLWHLDMEGNRENDQFYHLLLKKKEPISLWEVLKSNQNKKKKLRRMIAEEANLISDGRFVQLSNGTWGLTEWDLNAGEYPLKNLVIKAFLLHPGGLSLPQVVSVVEKWRDASEVSVAAILHKYPYFERQGENVWLYNQAAHRVYEEVMRKYLGILREQKKRWYWEREQWHKKYTVLKQEAEEVSAAQRESAAAMAAQVLVRDQNDHLAAQLSEKDLLLSLRKKEILYYQDQVRRLEAKAASLLHQCRLWVKRARDGEAASADTNNALDTSRADLESMFTKLQQAKEKYREAKARLAELKEDQATRVAVIQGEIIELREQAEKARLAHKRRERYLEGEIERLQGDLKNSLDAGEELQRSTRFMQQEMTRTRQAYRHLEKQLSRPLVRLVIRLSQGLSGWRRQSER